MSQRHMRPAKASRSEGPVQHCLGQPPAFRPYDADVPSSVVSATRHVAVSCTVEVWCSVCLWWRQVLAGAARLNEPLTADHCALRSAITVAVARSLPVAPQIDAPLLGRSSRDDGP